MTHQLRFDHIGVTVADIGTATEFFVVSLSDRIG